MSAVISFDLAHGEDRTAYCVAHRLPDGRISIDERGELQRRIVRSTQRKRKLRRRGESIWWDAKVGAFIWYRRVRS